MQFRKWRSVPRPGAAVRFGCLLTVLLVAGCVPRFANPLSDAQSSQRDDRLIGRWAQEHGDGELGRLLHIEAHPTSPTELQLLETTDKESTSSPPRIRVLAATQIGQQHYLSLENDRGQYYIAEYTWTDTDHLVLRQFSTEVLGEQIAAGKLAGDTKVRSRDGKVTYLDVLVLAETADLRKLVGELGEGILSQSAETKRTVYRRMK